MEIFGKEYKFTLTVEAMTKVAEACPNKDINRLEEWVGTGIISTSNALKVMAPAMSKAYHDVQKEIDPSYSGAIFSPRLVDLMTVSQVGELMDEIMSSFEEGNKTSVETRSKKKDEAQAST